MAQVPLQFLALLLGDQVKLAPFPMKPASNAARFQEIMLSLDVLLTGDVALTLKCTLGHGSWWCMHIRNA